MSDPLIPPDLFERYEVLRRYVGWSDADADRLAKLGPLVEPSFSALIDDFYQAIERSPAAARVITGGRPQIRRLRGTLKIWLQGLFSGHYSREYVARRWRVGWRHVEIGLQSVFTSAALARLRTGLTEQICTHWTGEVDELHQSLASLNRLLDLDLAIIQDAYETEFVQRQRRSERERSEATFRRMVEAAHSVIAILHLDGSIAYINPFTEQLTGFAAATVKGRPYLEVFVAEEEQPSTAVYLDEVRQGSQVRGLESHLLCRDHSQRWLLWSAQQLEDFEGNPALLIIGHDVTDQQRAEQRALQAERLAAIGQTVTGLAHESRNAFQRSQACLELLAIELEGQDGKLELVDRIQRALDHLHRLYEEVRDYAAPINLELQTCDLAHLWRDAWGHLEVSRRERNVEMNERLNSTHRDCQADWFAMGQVFRNIFENALAASPAGSVIEVDCSEGQIEGQAALRVAVRDQGPGIPAEVQPFVFDAFYTTRSKGTGLGMAIARRIVEAHGGHLSLGNPRRGAEFVMLIPSSSAHSNRQ